MSAYFGWLPPLVLLSEHGGNWPKYEAALYAIFVEDFVVSKPTFRGRRLGLKRHPLSNDKEAAFWHLTSTGDVEAERIPEMRKCERIAWPRPGITNCNVAGVKVWSVSHGQEQRISIWLEEDDYVIILADRGDYLLPWTAFHVTQDHYRRKLQRQYDEWKSA